MKTCKNCIFLVDWDEETPPIYYCHLNPKKRLVHDPDSHWCGQLKEGINMGTHHLLIEWARQPENAVKILGMMK